jgi:aminoglycoside 3-N-acetyltransferase
MLAQESLGAAFAEAGLESGDTLMLHGDALALTQIAVEGDAAARAEVLFQAIEAVLGPGGTLIMPSFTYSATKNEVFDPATTPGTVGMLAELFRLRPGTARTAQPIFSVAVRGAGTSAIMAGQITDCFGPGSVFDRLYETNALIACLGCGFDRITFVHYVEQRLEVPYRFMKRFDARIVEAGRERAVATDYLVRDLARETETDLSRLKSALQAAGLLKIVPFGRAALMAVRARDFFVTAASLVAARPNALIREGV